MFPVWAAASRNRAMLALHFAEVSLQTVVQALGLGDLVANVSFKHRPKQNGQMRWASASRHAMGHQLPRHLTERAAALPPIVLQNSD